MQQDEQKPKPSTLIAFARERLQAAETLIQQGISGPAVDLLVSALLATAAERADKPQAPSVEQAGVWVYSEALPKGWLDDKQAALIMRGVALLHSDTIPQTMLEALCQESREFIDGSDQFSDLDLQT